MVYKDGHWRYNTWNIPIDMMYLQWSYKDRIKLTRLFMQDLDSPLGLPLGPPRGQLWCWVPCLVLLQNSFFTMALGLRLLVHPLVPYLVPFLALRLVPYLKFTLVGCLVYHLAH